MNGHLESQLKKKKLRVTEARQNIYQILSKSSRSLSAREVFENIKKSSDLKSDQASVYRNLTLFTELGIAHRFQDGRYAICKHDHDHDHNHTHMHILANCNKCGKSIEIESHTEGLCKVVKQAKSFVESFGHISGLTFTGVCKSCLSRS